MKKELEIYIHIPFCVKKCHYCDFLSGPADEEAKEIYHKALCMEMREKSKEYTSYRVTSVFFGGGTPSSVKPERITEIMEIVKGQYHLAENAEISMEVNPGTVDRRALHMYYEAGINRLSMGLQSAREEELKLLGRIHSYEQFLEAYFTAREIGFSNINVDLMSGLPGQSLEHYRESLHKVTQLEPAPEHISAYSLIIEEGTPFYRAYEKGELQLPEEDTEREMYELTRSLLADRGYERYEISNYARKGQECRHNIGYWQRKNYAGFGIGAASLIENVRFKNVDNMNIYIKDPCNSRTDVQILSLEEQMEEFFFLGLRLTEGVSYSAFQEAFCRNPEEVYGGVIEKHVKQGLLQKYTKGAEEYLRLTLRGLDVSNYVMADFLEP